MAKKVVIIGGGVAGVTAALTLGKLELDLTLIEKSKALISGPPFCHLHAGGNLYREIPTADCVTLLRQSIDFAKLFPFAIDKRPTIFATPTYDPHEPLDLIDRLNTLKQEYKKLVDKDSSNLLLGKPDNYFEIFDKEQLLELAKREPLKLPKNNKEWLIPFAKSLDFSTIKFPVIVVQEYGINLFRVAANSGLALEKMPNVEILRECEAVDIKESSSGYIVKLSGSSNAELEADYLINAAGFRSGLVDDMLGVKQNRLVEFKAAYTTRWEEKKELWPEVIFHGVRGTHRGMGQFTPYCNGLVQLHAMTPDITLFEDGLVKSPKESSYPKLDKKFIDIIEKGWSKELLEERTKRAIEYLSYFIPSFKSAKIGTKPLFGAQQIIGDNPDLRVAEVSFPKPRYARCEIVKVSSVNDMVTAIAKDISKEFNIKLSKNLFSIYELKALKDEEIDKRACSVANLLEYPCEIGKRCNK